MTGMRAMATATAIMWVIATATRLAGDKEGKVKGGKGYGDSNEGGGNKDGKGRKAMAMATRMVGEQMATATKREIAKKTREVGKEERNGKGGKSNVNSKEDGNVVE